MTTRKPDYNLTVMNKETNEKSGTLGSGWINEDGSIGVKLSPGVALVGGNPDLVIRLWPTESKTSNKSGNRVSNKSVSRRQDPHDYDDNDYDDVPF